MLHQLLNLYNRSAACLLETFLVSTCLLGFWTKHFYFGDAVFSASIYIVWFIFHISTSLDGACSITNGRSNGTTVWEGFLRVHKVSISYNSWCSDLMKCHVVACVCSPALCCVLLLEGKCNQRLTHLTMWSSAGGANLEGCRTFRTQKLAGCGSLTGDPWLGLSLMTVHVSSHCCSGKLLMLTLYPLNHGSD